MRHLGFTGTKNGMTDSQKRELREYLTLMLQEGYTHFHHGDCIGADAQAARIAKDLGFIVIAHPGHPKDKENTMYRAFTDFNDEVREVKPFITRDHDIVDESESMVATPQSEEEEVRSGTWTTVRYARKTNKPVKIIAPPFKPNVHLTGKPVRTNAIAGEPRMQTGIDARARGLRNYFDEE